MIVYYKLENILKERDMTWKSLCDAGISINTPTKFKKKQTMNTEIIDKVCAFLKVQPGDIMEWIDEKAQKETELERKIEAMKAELEKLEKEKAKLK